ncbi:MAG: hypothetical protein ACE5JM_08265 [Armatimonadota bacterium]
MGKIKYEEMLPHEIVAARTKCPIAYVGIGGVELVVERITARAKELLEGA